MLDRFASAFSLSLLLSWAFIIASCRSRSFNPSSVGLSEADPKAEVCGEPISYDSADGRLALRVDFSGARRLRALTPSSKAVQGRLVEVSLERAEGKLSEPESWRPSKRICVTLSPALDGERLIAKSVSVRDARTKDVELTVSGKVIQSDSLYALTVEGKDGASVIALLGRDIAATNTVLQAALGKNVIARGHPLLAQDTLALLVDSDSIYESRPVIAEVPPLSLTVSDSIGRDEANQAAAIGKRWAEDYLKDRDGKSDVAHQTVPKNRIHELSERIVRLDSELLEEKFEHMEYEERHPGRDLPGHKVFGHLVRQAEHERCCELLLEAQEAKTGFARLFKRGGASVSMYQMDGRSDFAEIRQAIKSPASDDELDVEDL